MIKTIKDLGRLAGRIYLVANLGFLGCVGKEEFKGPLNLEVEGTSYRILTDPSLFQIKEIKRVLSDTLYTGKRIRIDYRYNEKKGSVRYTGIDDSTLARILKEIDWSKDGVINDCESSDALVNCVLGRRESS